MKKLGAVVSLALLIVMLACPFAYAANSGLELVTMSPKDGQTGLQPLNVAVKMTFNQNMTSKEAQKANEDCFQIVGKDGKKVPYMAVYDARKYPNDVWLILKKDLKPNTEYKFKVSKDLMASDGTTLGKGINSTFKIRNTQTDATINMVMMVVMMGGMLFFTSVEQKRKLKKEHEEDLDDVNLNPYKIAKEKNISVEEANKFVAKEREKLEKKKAKLLAQQMEEDEEDPYIQRVSRKRPIAAAGGATPQSVLVKKQKKREAQELERKKRLERELARQQKAQKAKKK